MSEIDFESVLETLAIATERTEAEIETEIRALMDENDYTLAGAIAVWKSDNQWAFAVETTAYTARVIVFEPSRTANTDSGTSTVANVHFEYLNPETGEIEFMVGAVWGKERIADLEPQFENGKVYSFEASTNPKGQLTRIGPIKERDEDGKVTATLGIIEEDDDAAPSIDDIEPMMINKLEDSVGSYEFVSGIVGQVIYDKGTTTAIGCQLADPTTLRPLRLWFAGKYSKMTPADIQAVRASMVKTVELSSYGYVNKSGVDMNMNASVIWFAE